MKSKTAQIALYIILGLIFLFVAVVGIYFVANLDAEKVKAVTEDFQDVPLELRSLKFYIDKCANDLSIESVRKIGLQGGYFVLPLEFFDNGYVYVPYYYDEGQNLMPTKKRIEEDLAALITTRLSDCTDFSTFEQQGYNISFGNFHVNASMKRDKVLVKLDLPLSVTKNGVTKTISKFSYELPIRLGHIYDASKALVNQRVKEPYYIDLTYLLGQDLDISVIHEDGCTDLYIIFDNYSISKYLFLFATKLDKKFCNEINSAQIYNIPDYYAENNPPILDAIPYSTAYVNKTFSYNLTAYDKDNDKLLFLDNTDLFFTNPLTGSIHFTPKSGQEGLYQINITVVDINGATDTGSFYLEVK